MTSHFSWLVIAILIALSIILLLSVPQTEKESTFSLPLDTQLLVTGTPVLNQTVQIAFTVRAKDNVYNLTVNIILPGGLRLISGDNLWEGDLNVGDSVNLFLTTKAVKLGAWTIGGIVAQNTRIGAESIQVPILITESFRTSRIGEAEPIPSYGPI